MVSDQPSQAPRLQLAVLDLALWAQSPGMMPFMMVHDNPPLHPVPTSEALPTSSKLRSDSQVLSHPAAEGVT